MGRKGVSEFIAATLFLAGACLCGAEFNIDISKSANMGFRDDVPGDGKGGWSDQGSENDIGEFNVSRRDFGGMDFKLIDPAKNGGKAVMTFDSKYAKTGLKEAFFDLSGSNTEGRYLYILHTSCWNQEAQGTPIGSIEVMLEDGSGTCRDIKAGTDVTDWWNPGSCENAMTVFKKINKSSEVGIFLSKINLASRDVKVKSVKFTSNDKVVWIVLGATISSKDLDLRPGKIVFKAGNGWKVVDMSDVQVKKDSALDLSSILEKGPAGQHGRVMVSNKGFMAFEKSPDVPRRFFGFNGLFHTLRKLEGATPEITKERIRKYAELVRIQGYDIIRPLVLEIYLMEGAKEEDGKFNPIKLDNVDFLISELKKNGVYTYLTVGAYRGGMKDPWNFSDSQKTGHYMARMYIGEEKIRKNWKAVAENMLSHVNPYTGVAWKDEAAIACVEFYNEQEIGLMRLTRIDAETKKLYDTKWRAWLLAKYKSCEKVSEALDNKKLKDQSEFDKYGIPGDVSSIQEPAVNELGLFMRDLSRDQMEWCENIVRKAGYKGLISQFNFSKHMLDSAIRWETSPLISMNTYFCHPSEFSRPGSKCSQTSSAGQAASYWRDANSVRFADRPLFITEHNHAFWNRYQHEDGLVFASLSSFQGFAELTVHEDAVALEVTEPNIDFSIARSPVGRGNEFVAACLFRRADVKEAQHRVELQIPLSYITVDSNGNRAVNTDQSKIALLTGFSVSFPELKRAVKSEPKKADLAILPVGGAEVKTGSMFADVVESKDSSFSLDKFTALLREKSILPKSNISDPANGIFQNETGEITFRTQENLIKVITPRTEGVSLEAGKSEKLGFLSVESSSEPASVTICSVDGKDLSDSLRMVLVYSTEIANTDMELSEDRVTMRNGGKLPILMKTGKLKASFKCKSPEKMELYALKIDGTRKDKIPLKVSGSSIEIDIDTETLKEGPSVFFELVYKG